MQRLYKRRPSIIMICTLAIAIPLAGFASAQKKNKRQRRKRRNVARVEITYPPKLPGRLMIVSDTSPDFLKPAGALKPGVTIAKNPPRVDFLYFPGQNYPGKPWSNWGDGSFADGKYYTAIGDHLAIGSKVSGANGTGTGFVFEYDPQTRKLRQLVNTSKVLKMPEGHYTPGKIHSRVELGSDGWLYYATHRGSKRATIDKYHYKGDWIFRTHPQTGKTEVVAHGPVPNHAIPNSTLDPDRLIFYGGTAAGVNSDRQDILFFAYDLKKRKMLYVGPDGPARYMIFARSTGRVYYVPGNQVGELMRFDPRTAAAPKKLKGTEIGIRAATKETKDGIVYTVSTGQRAADATIYAFNTKTETTRKVGTAAVASQAYIASIDVDPTGRYLYYVPGAHGGSVRDGSPVVQFDVKTGRKKILAFLHPFYEKKYGLALKGTYSTAIDAKGEKLFITWNVSRGSRAWDCCGLTVLHIPKSER